MKKIILLTILFAGCHSNHNGFYVNHTEGPYAITDDTLEVRDTLLIEHTGYQKIRNGKTLPKAFKTRQLFELHPRFQDNKLILNNTTYEKI